ncbi:hypothetical protein EY04_13460 [Pseudomonas chlororaphis]|jgi:hypothetical protein|nr:hypothetical protein EY04_13460 [Pseudomonas chlororaphis]
MAFTALISQFQTAGQRCGGVDIESHQSGVRRRNFQPDIKRLPTDGDWKLLRQDLQFRAGIAAREKHQLASAEDE